MSSSQPQLLFHKIFPLKESLVGWLPSSFRHWTGRGGRGQFKITLYHRLTDSWSFMNSPTLPTHWCWSVTIIKVRLKPNQGGDYHCVSNFKDKIGLHHISSKLNLPLLKHQLRMTSTPAIFVSLFSRFLSRGSFDITWFQWNVLFTRSRDLNYCCQISILVSNNDYHRSFVLRRKIREHLSGL